MSYQPTWEIQEPATGGFRIHGKLTTAQALAFIESFAGDVATLSINVERRTPFTAAAFVACMGDAA